MTTEWIRRFHPAPTARVHLVCFPHAGGSASFYRPISTELSPDVDVVTLQYPGRQDRRHEPSIPSISELAENVVTELQTLDGKPTVFFGHSMGAVLAFETAWRLERQHPNRAPFALIASGRRGPSTTRDERVHESDDAGLVAELTRLNGIDTTLLDDELLRSALPALRNDYRAIETYTCPPDRAVRCPITVLAGNEDPKTTVEEATVWNQHTEGTFRIEIFPGGHFYLVDHQTTVLHEIRTEISRAQPAAEERSAQNR